MATSRPLEPLGVVLASGAEADDGDEVGAVCADAVDCDSVAADRVAFGGADFGVCGEAADEG